MCFFFIFNGLKMWTVLGSLVFKFEWNSNKLRHVVLHAWLQGVCLLNDFIRDVWLGFLQLDYFSTFFLWIIIFYFFQKMEDGGTVNN